MAAASTTSTDAGVSNPRCSTPRVTLITTGLRLRTTGGYAPDERWVYTEYDTGEVELYDLVADPWQLENLAASPEHAAVLAELGAVLHDEVIGPDGVTFRTTSASDDEEG